MINIATLRRRWPQYGLWTVLVFMLLASIWFAAKMKQATQQREVVVKMGGGVIYDYQGVDKSGGRLRSSDASPYRAWLREVLGADFCSVVIAACVRSDAEMAHVGGLTHIRFLEIYNRSVTDAGMEHLRPLTELETLCLFGTQVTQAGLERLVCLKQLHTLEIRRMPQVTDRWVDCLKGLPQLRRLVLSETNVTDAGIRELKEALPNCRVERQ